MVKSQIFLTVVGKALDGKQPVLAHDQPVVLKTFNDGAVLVELPDEIQKAITNVEADHVWIEARIKDSDGLVAIPSLAAFIRRLNTHVTLRLNMPYLPHGRQDRYTGNNAFTFKYSVANVINPCNFEHIVVMDAHNTSVLPLFDSPSLFNRELVDTLPKSFEDALSSIDIVVAPDAGALKNSEKYAKLIGKPLVTASKSRDPSNGYIVYNGVYGEPVAGKTVLIADDLVEGGATVRLLAEMLKREGAAKVIVFTTHGLFPRGFDHLRGSIDHIYTYYSWVPEADVPSDYVTVSSYF